jgi:hypothetical protein
MDRAPFRRIIGWWASDHGVPFVHASAVASAAGAALLAGPSGSGKSTTALTCVLDGMDLLGDDVTLVELGPPAAAHSVYGWAKVEPNAIARLPALASMRVGVRVAADGEQTVVRPARLARQAPLRALLFPTITGDERSEVVDMSPRDALATLVPASLLEGGASGGGALRSTVALVRAVPSRRLLLGTDAASIVAAVRGALG